MEPTIVALGWDSDSMEAIDPVEAGRTAYIYAPADRVRPYLPDNYHVAMEAREEGHSVIVGRDVAGWTLGGYVLPRLASGLIFGEELTD